MTTYPAHVVAAWRESIAKWRRNAEAKTPEEYTTRWMNCPLCLIFLEGGIGQCQGCPVSMKTGRPHCDGTPYRAAHNARAYWQIEKEGGNAARAAATVMADWLEALDVEEN